MASWDHDDLKSKSESFSYKCKKEDHKKSFLESVVNDIVGDTNNQSEYYAKKIEEKEKDFIYKFEEHKLIKELDEYVKSTYNSHYSGEKYQATDLIVDSGHGVGFCIGNIIKYCKRYGKKDGYNEKDLFKILHYGLILLYASRQKSNQDN